MNFKCFKGGKGSVVRNDIYSSNHLPFVLCAFRAFPWKGNHNVSSELKQDNSQKKNLQQQFQVYKFTSRHLGPGSPLLRTQYLELSFVRDRTQLSPSLAL